MKQWGHITANTLREFWRQPSVIVLLGFAVWLSGGGGWWRDFNFGLSDGRFVLNFGWGVQGVVAPLVGIIGVAQTLMQELDRGTAAVLRARGVGVHSFLGGKILAVWLVLAGFLICASVWIAVILAWEGFPVPGAEMVRHLGGGLAKNAVVICFTAWFASYGRSLVFVVLAACLWLILGQLRVLFVEGSELLRMVALVVPDMSYFHSGAGHVGGEVEGVEGVKLAGRFAYGTIYSAVFFGLAVVTWRHRDY